MRYAWPLFLLIGCTSACAPIRLAERPLGEQTSGAGVVVGRLVVGGMPATGWDDPFDQALGGQILLVQFRTAHGDRLLAPCRADGVFAARLPAGPTTLDATALTTRHGSWISLQPIQPLRFTVQGACDLGALTLAVPPLHAEAWSRLRQSDRVIRQSGTIPVTLHPAPDAQTVSALKALAEGHWQWSTHPLTVRQGVYGRFEALCRRLGLN
jgi:hypothetical protein